MKRHTIIVSLVLISCIGNAQITFQKSYSTSSLDQTFSGQKTSDGGYIVAGNKYDFSIGYSKVFLIKTNEYGDSIWTKTYEILGNDLTGYNSKQTSDGGFIICGGILDTSIIDVNIFLIKTDSNGSILWQKSFAATGVDRGYSVMQTQDYGFVITGYTNSFSATSSGEVCLIKTDLNGNLLWTKIFSNSGSIYLSGYSINLTNDGGFIIAGSVIPIGTTFTSICLIKTDSIGNALWSKSYSAGCGDGQSYVQQTSDGGFVMTGTTYVQIGPMSFINHISLIKTDTMGNLVWAKKFAGNYNDWGFSGKQTNDHGYIITGGSTSFWGNGLYSANVFLIKTDSNGTINWCKYYGSNQNSSDYAYDIEQTNDGYIVSGVNTNNSGFQTYLLKTDLIGNVGCNGYTFALNDSAYFFSVSALSLTNSSQVFNQSSTSIIVDHFNYLLVDPCSVGINEMQSNIQVRVFPNPSNGIFEFNRLENDTEIEIYNSLGTLIIKANSSKGSFKIDLSEKNKGIYFYKIFSKDKEVNQGKLVLQ